MLWTFRGEYRIPYLPECKFGVWPHRLLSRPIANWTPTVANRVEVQRTIFTIPQHLDGDGGCPGISHVRRPSQCDPSALIRDWRLSVNHGSRDSIWGDFVGVWKIKAGRVESVEEVMRLVLGRDSGIVLLCYYVIMCISALILNCSVRDF